MSSLLKTLLLPTVMAIPMAALHGADDPVAPATEVLVRASQEAKTAQPLKTLTRDSLLTFAPKPVALSPYGGRADRREKATGFFRTQKLADRWILVDPDGYEFISVGLNAVGTTGKKKTVHPEILQKYGNVTNWARQTKAAIEGGLRFNTLGCWSDPEYFEGAGARMPYTPRWNFMGTYMETRSKYENGAKSGKRTFIPAFDPEFEPFCEKRGDEIAATKRDPFLLGHFSDNELPLKQDKIISKYLALEDRDPGKKAVLGWLANRGKSPADVTAADDGAFCEFVIARYYEVVNRVLKKYDPNHLFIGSRFHGYVTRQRATFRGCGPFVDVVSVNYYHAWTPSQSYLNEWSALSGKPVLITEWYAKGDDSGLNNGTGAGFSVSTQADRGKFYQNFTLGLLKNPNVVGWHWFKFRDDTDSEGGTGDGFVGCNKGAFQKNYEPWPELTRAMKEINTVVYSLADHIRSTASANWLLENGDSTGKEKGEGMY